MSPYTSCGSIQPRLRGVNRIGATPGLYVIRDDDSVFCLIEPLLPLREKRENLAVKNFRWHPREDFIFCVMGCGAGTISVGGDIYGVDLSGKRRLLIRPDQDKSGRQEITMNIAIVRDSLAYEVAQWDSLLCYFVGLEKKKANVDDLLAKYYESAGK